MSLMLAVRSQDQKTAAEFGVVIEQRREFVE
jgi:hypothetical protein